MRCPECSFNQKVKYGMKCDQCGYIFVLNPKESPYIADAAFKACIEKLSGNGQYYFTFNQLYFAIYKLTKKKIKTKKISSSIGYGIGILVISFILTNALELSPAIGLLIAIIGIIGMIWYVRESTIVSHWEVSMLIKTYQSAHPITNMVSGNQFQNMGTKEINKEFFNYAPERIMIVEHDDLLDMLVLNHFHFENKTLIVSATKYPNYVFEVCQRFLEKHPDIPVYIVHDASLNGIRLKDKLLSDRRWNLKDKNVKDLGLFPEDIAHIKQPMWISSTSNRKGGITITGDVSTSNSPKENIDKGLKFPVDLAAPKNLLVIMAGAVIGGMILMSEELMTEVSDDPRKFAIHGGFG